MVVVASFLLPTLLNMKTKFYFWVITHLLCFSLSQQSLFSQSLQLELFSGMANYIGDLKEREYALNRSRIAWGVGVSKEVSRHINICLAMTHSRLSGYDSENKNPALVSRNLSFETSITEFSLSLQTYLFNLRERQWSPFLMGGIAVFHYDPFIFDLFRNKVYLRNLGTEGQGLSIYPDKKQYRTLAYALPVGCGIKWNINDQLQLSWEMGFRFTSTDYLDDVSTTYPDGNFLLREKGPQALEWSYRGDELKGGMLTYPVAGTKRGSAKNMDWYYFTGIRLSVELGEITPRFPGVIRCPKVIF